MNTHFPLRVLCTVAVLTLLVACAPSAGANMQLTERGAEVDATNPSITSVFVELSLYGITGARWEIPIPH